MSDVRNPSDKLPIVEIKRQLVLNDRMLEEKASQEAFDTAEINALYSGSDFERLYQRDWPLGTTAQTYGNWQFFDVDEGYGIWKYDIPNISDDTRNRLVDRGKHVYRYAGEAASESLTAFTAVIAYSGGAYQDRTSEVADDSSSTSIVTSNSSEYLYIGSSEQFTAADFELSTAGKNVTLSFAYSSGNGFSTTPFIKNDYTLNMTGSGKVDITLPSDWGKVTISGNNLYWLRLETLTLPTQIPKVTTISPGDNVKSLLSLSQQQLSNEDWAWCLYSGSLYMTVRNLGGDPYEGNYYLKSGSSAANKEAFFTVNHQFYLDYRKSDWVHTRVNRQRINFFIPTPTANSDHIVGVRVEDAGRCYLDGVEVNTEAPSGGPLILRVGTESGNSPSAYQDVTVADGDTYAKQNAAVTFLAGQHSLNIHCISGNSAANANVTVTVRYN